MIDIVILVLFLCIILAGIIGVAGVAARSEKIYNNTSKISFYMLTLSIVAGILIMIFSYTR